MSWLLLGYNQVDQYTHYRNSRRREKGAERLFEEIVAEMSKIWGGTWIYKSRKLSKLQVGKAQRDPHQDML